jgi:hypothetical protein
VTQARALQDTPALPPALVQAAGSWEGEFKASYVCFALADVYVSLRGVQPSASFFFSFFITLSPSIPSILFFLNN